MFSVILLALGVASEPTTTTTYDIEVPGADPIRIVEGEPLWPSKFEHRSFDGTEDPLRQFLATYAETIRKNKIKEEKENASTEKAKGWDLVQFQRHKHPYEDKKGWVSMEAVPWSVSKISKWQSKYKATTPRPWEDYDTEDVRPWNKPSNYYEDPKPLYSKPMAIYNQKVHVDYNTKHDDNCKHTRPHRPQTPLFGDGDIITDGLPANFPQPYESNRRQGTDIHPDTNPFSGEGEWVLLSTTKGYKFPPHRQRALQINPDSIGTHHGVQLTVLPPSKNSKVNMTTSHGGLLQVEATLQTVEQSRRQFNKKQKMKKKPKPVKQVAAPTVVTTTRNAGPDSSAVLAAVGAGMIPATMAMLVPMALGGRRKREVPSTTALYPETLPRNL